MATPGDHSYDDSSALSTLTPLRGASMQRCALLDWSVRLRGATPNYAPRTPQVRYDDSSALSTLTSALPLRV